MEPVRRTIETRVEEAGDGCRASARLSDPFHEIEVCIELRGDRTIGGATGTMRWIPYGDRCPDALLPLAALTGLRVGPELGRRVREQLGGASGCPYVVELVMQACQFALVATMTERARAAVLERNDRADFAALREQMGQCAGHRDLPAERLPAWLDRDRAGKTGGEPQ